MLRDASKFIDAVSNDDTAALNLAKKSKDELFISIDIEEEQQQDKLKSIM